MALSGSQNQLIWRKELEKDNTQFVPDAGSDVVAFGSRVGDARWHLKRINNPGRPDI